MARDTDLLRRLRLAGLFVDETAGWQTRGDDVLHALGSVNHHTAGPDRGVQPSLGVIINGRGGDHPLPGPLANVHKPREQSYRVNLVAAGKANHAGVGHWHGVSQNLHFLGLEVEHCGYAREPITDLDYDVIVRVHAAFAFGTFDPSMVAQHYEFAEPPGRKVDFVRALIDPNKFRLDVAARMALMAGVNPNPITPPAGHTQGDDMALAAHPDGHLEEFDLLDGSLMQNWQMGVGSVDWSGYHPMDPTRKYDRILGAVTKPDGSVVVQCRTKDSSELSWWYTPESGWHASPVKTPV